MTDWYSLPWQIQLALASGYAAYLLAFVGIRHHHRAIEVTLISLLFGLVTTATVALVHCTNNLVSGAIAFVATIAVAIIWRKFASDWLRKILRYFNVSWSNDDPSALATISNSKIPITQVAVQLDDGRWLRCDSAHNFNNAPFEPLTIGPDGDVALYLTHEDQADGTSKELSTVRDTNYGDRITYIPANRIRQLTIRHLRA